MKLSRGARLTIFTVSMIVIDQVIKYLVKTNMTLGQSIHVFGDWCQIFFVENNGMAFGMQFGAVVGKLILSLSRIVIVGFLAWYIHKLLKNEETPVGVLFGLTAIMCGAIGNIIDSLFYGMIFSESTFTQVATLFPPEGGYSGFLLGKVVDMFYFPIIHVGDFIFFRPIFNFADSCVTCGVFYLILFQWKFFANKK